MFLRIQQACVAMLLLGLAALPAHAATLLGDGAGYTVQTPYVLADTSPTNAADLLTLGFGTNGLECATVTNFPGTGNLEIIPLGTNRFYRLNVQSM